MRYRGPGAALAAGLAACLFCVTISGQQTAAIHGLVVDDQGDPVPGARVGAARGDAPERTMVTTSAGDDGRFALDGLPAATYTLALSKQGYVNTAFGQAFPGGPAVQIPLRDGDRREITARLPRSGVITGVIRGDDGAPRAGVPVHARRWVLVRGRRSLRNEGRSTVTNSRGEYRIWDLAPGSYFVTARLNRPDGLQVVDMRSPGADVQFPPRHYPGVTELALATPIVVTPGDVVTGIDVDLVAEPAGTLIVEVVNPTPMTTVNLRVAWHPTPADSSESDYGRRATESPDGRFVMRAVPAGHHVVAAQARVRGVRGQMPPPPLWAWVPIAAGAGTDEITLTLAPGASVAGRILSRDNPAQLDIGRIRPALIAIDSPFGEQRFTESGDRELSGHFEIAGLPPGEFRVELSGLPPGWIPVEAIVDDRDVLDRALVVRSGERIDSMVIVLSNRPASVAGTVTGADDAPACLDPVVVFPVDRARRGPASRWIRLAQPDVDGRYEVRDLPPGEYFIAAAPIDWNPALEPDRLLEIEALARRTRLPAGEPVQLDLRVVR